MADASDLALTSRLEQRRRQASYPRTLVGCALVALLSLAGCTTSVKVGPEAVAGLTPDGTVDMNEVQVAYIGSGGGGNGTLFYHGGVYPFTIAGLGVGGIGASTISAEGEVYKLNNLASFGGLRPGTLRLRNRQHERGRSVDAERSGRHHAPQGQAHRPDAEPRRGRRRHIHVAIIQEARRLLIQDDTHGVLPMFGMRPPAGAVRCMVTACSFCSHRPSPGRPGAMEPLGARRQVPGNCPMSWS